MRFEKVIKEIDKSGLKSKCIAHKPKVPSPAVTAPDIALPEKKALNNKRKAIAPPVDQMTNKINSIETELKKGNEVLIRVKPEPKIKVNVSIEDYITKPAALLTDTAMLTRQGFVWSFWKANKSIIPVVLADEIETLCEVPLSHDTRVILAESFNKICKRAIDKDKESIDNLKRYILSEMQIIQGNLIRNIELLKPEFSRV